MPPKRCARFSLASWPGGRPPPGLSGALDLAIVVPLAFLAGIWLWRRRPWGYVVAVVWNVKGAVYMLALTTATASAYWTGAGTGAAQVGLWLPIGLGCLLSTAVLFRGYEEPSE